MPLCGAAGQAVQAGAPLRLPFFPCAGGEHLVIKVIDSARSEIKLLAYSFTSAPITRVLIDARKREVSMSVVADEKSYLSEGGGNQKAVVALSALANAVADVRTTSAFAIHQDKFLCVDKMHVETGSFSASPETHNS